MTTVPGLARLLDGHESRYMRQQRQGFAWLRFESALEREYAQFNALGFRGTRQAAMVLLILTLLGFLVFDLSIVHRATHLGTGVLITRVLMIALAVFCFLRLRKTYDLDAGARWALLAQASTSAGTLLIILLYAQGHDALKLPLLLDGMTLIFITVLFPLGYGFWNSARLLALVTALGWLLIPNLVDEAMRHDFFVQMPFQLSVLIALIAMRYYQEHATRAQFLMNGSLQHIASVDGLTGLYNRRAFELMVQQSLCQVHREHCWAALLLVDVDHFKKYNDHYGHPAGDEALKAVAQALAQVPMRPLDLAARVGGEEFALFFYDVNQEFAEKTAARICRDIERGLSIPHTQSSAAEVVTLSIGIAITLAGEALDPLYRRADEALYQAKTEGRNRACLASPEPVMSPP